MPKSFRRGQLSSDKKELESRLYSINTEFEQLAFLFCEKTKAIDRQGLEVVKLQDEVDSTPAITEETIIEALATVRKSMEVAREEF